MNIFGTGLPVPWLLFAASPDAAGPAGLEKATFAGGCFWCMVAPFDAVEGVVRVVSGYTGGTTKNPTYEEVCSGTTGHLEAVEITFDPRKVSYEKLLDIFWKQIDPADPGGQFADRGSQYGTAVFYHNEQQREAAERSKAQLQASGRFDRPVVTVVRRAEPFYPAEEYHQAYHAKNPFHYRLYRSGSGRQSYIEKTWSERACPIRRKK